MPPVPPTGFYVTYTADDWADVDSSCFPNPPGAYNEDLCMSIRDPFMSHACLRANCMPLLSWVGDPGAYYVGNGYSSEQTGYVRLYNSVANDGGSFPLARILQYFIQNNSYASTPPTSLNIYGFTKVFTPADAATGMAIDSGAFAGQLALAQYNSALLRNFNNGFVTGGNLELQREVARAAEYIMATPSRCPDEDFASIEWLAHHNVSWMRLCEFLEPGGMGVIPQMAIPLYSEIEVSGAWDDFCLNTLFPDQPEYSWFCNLFPWYYSIESLSNASITPSPWKDLTAIMRALSEEYVYGEEPRGCFGVVPPFSVPTSWTYSSIVTFIAEDFEEVNSSCVPPPGSNFSSCNDYRSDKTACMRAFCTVMLTEMNDPVVSFTIGRATLLSSDSFPDGGAVRVVQLLQKFMIDNIPTVGGTRAQPMNTTHVFDTTAYGSGSFATSATEFARQVAAALWNRKATKTFNVPGYNSTEFYYDLIFTADYLCEDEDLIAIPWLSTWEARVDAVITAADAMLGADVTSSDFDPSNWPTACPTITGLPIFCAAFPGYYAMESLRDFDMVPSPYEDFLTLMRVNNIDSSAVDGYYPGCVGQPLRYPLV